MASIQGIYLAFFGRPADPLGLAYWEEQTNGGADLSVMLNALSGTEEYQARFVNMTNAEVIESIYEALFGREPDAEGLAHFLDSLANGSQTLGSIAVNILDGAQGIDLAIVENKIAAADIFTAALDTDAEIAAYSGDAAADFGRALINQVTENPASIPTASEVQGQINDDLPDYNPNPGQTPGGGTGTGTGTGPTPNPDPADIFLARWAALDSQYYDFAARGEEGPGINLGINNAFIQLANDYVTYLNAGNAAIVNVIQQKIQVGDTYINDVVRVQTFHDNVLGNINGAVLGNGRPKTVELVSAAAAKFSDRPLADGRVDNISDENAAWSWDFANGIHSGKYPFNDTVIVASGSNSSGFGDVSVKVEDSIRDAVSVALSGDIIHVRPGNYKEHIDLTGDKTLKLSGVPGSVIDGTGSTHGLKATGETYTGTVTVDGFTVIAGSQGGIVQFMTASAGKFIVTNNRIEVSDKSYSAHGNGIQITGRDSLVSGNTVDATPYTAQNSSWSTSGITVVKDASNSSIVGNVVKLSDGRALAVNQSAIGIGVDGKYGPMSGVEILNNTVSKLSTGISLMEDIGVRVANNTLVENKYGIGLGTKTAGWDDDFDINISGNLFQGSLLADIAFFDFEKGAVTIGVNAFSGTKPALWFDEGGTYGSADGKVKISIDISSFTTGDTLADGAFKSSGSGFDIGNLKFTDDNGWVVTGKAETEFQYLEITLLNSNSFDETEIVGLFADPAMA